MQTAWNGAADIATVMLISGVVGLLIMHYKRRSRIAGFLWGYFLPVIGPVGLLFADSNRAADGAPLK